MLQAFNHIMENLIVIKEEPLFSSAECVLIKREEFILDENSIDLKYELKLEKVSQIEEEKAKAYDSLDLITKLENRNGEQSSVTSENKSTLETTGTSYLGPGSKLFICYYCGFTSDWRKLFVKHVCNHLYRFVCNICNYKTTRSIYLKRHKKIHSGEKPYKCGVCNYKCTASGNLQQHMRVHSGAKPFKCSVCSFKCTHSGNLKRHMRVHSLNKPLECCICSYKFVHSGSLKRHMAVHYQEKLYECNICSYQCNKGSSLRRHVNSNHKK